MAFIEQKNRVPLSDKNRLFAGLDRYDGSVTASTPEEEFVSANLDPTFPLGTRKVIRVKDGKPFYL